MRPRSPLHRVPGALDAWPLCGPLSPWSPSNRGRPLRRMPRPLPDTRPIPGVSLSSVLPRRRPPCPCDPVSWLPAYLRDSLTPTCANINKVSSTGPVTTGAHGHPFPLPVHVPESRKAWGNPSSVPRPPFRSAFPAERFGTPGVNEPLKFSTAQAQK